VGRVRKIITALRLYKLGSVQTLAIKWTPKSILQFGATVQPYVVQPIIYKYALASNESDKIKIFLDKVRPLIPITQGKIETTDYLSISLQRYNEALFKPNNMERVTYAIMGLEALFLKSSEREELSHRLAQRVAKCLSILNYQPIEIYRVLKQSYEVRSEFIHGAPIREDELRNSGELANKVMEYLRLSILVFMGTEKRKNRERKFYKYH